MIVTHNGLFHADETLAVAVLRLLGEETPLVRTRDPNIIARADYAIDVGGLYSPDQRRYDHHQTNFNETRPNGVIYASAGLVWKHWGEHTTRRLFPNLSDGQLVANIAAKVDERLFMAVDAHDNGQELVSQYAFPDVRPLTLSSIIAQMNPPRDANNEKNQTETFTQAVTLATRILENTIRRAHDTVSAENAVLNAHLEKIQEHAHVLVLDEGLPWQEALLAHPEIFRDTLFVIYPAGQCGWRLQCVPNNPNESSKRLPLPKAWAGLEGEALSQVTGIPGCIFCHKGLFIAGHETREGALALARLAITNS